jgi:FixJ family two-component response regulator
MNDVVPTVFMVEDTRDVRVALSRMLSAAGYEVRSFESAEHYLSDQAAGAPGCLLLDVCLPGLSGTELQHQLIDSKCVRPIVFMTGLGDIQTSVRAMKEGAIDFLTKPIDKERLFAAIDQAFRRDRAERGELAARRAIEKLLESLTARERQVLERVISGRLNKQIAADLAIGEKTVKVHRGRVMSKMAVRSVAELVRRCARVGVAREPALGWPAGLQCRVSGTPSAAMQRFSPPRAPTQLSVPCS